MKQDDKRCICVCFSVANCVWAEDISYFFILIIRDYKDNRANGGQTRKKWSYVKSEALLVELEREVFIADVE